MTFLERFFGTGNGILWNTLQDPASERRKALEPFLRLVDKRAEIAILPRVREVPPGPGVVRWYFLCRTDAAGRRARDLLSAFLGPSYLDLRGPPGRLDPSDPVDAAVAVEFGPCSFWTEVPSRLVAGSAATATPADTIRSRLQVLARMLDERPARTAPSHRPVGRILRDFEFAATRRDADTASACLAELDAAGYLAAANRHFLALRIDALRGETERIVDPARVEELLALRPPRQIVQTMLEAVYEHFLRRLDEPLYGAELLATYRGLPREYRALLRSRRGLSGRAVDLCFVLDAVAYSDHPAVAVREALAPVPENAPGRPTLEAVAALAPAPVPGEVPPVPDARPPLERAAIAFTLGDLDEAFVFAKGAPWVVERTALLLQIVQEAPTLETLAVAKEALAATSPGDLARLKAVKRTGAALAFLAEQEHPTQAQSEVPKAVPVPTSWSEWLDRLISPEPWAYAVKAAYELGPQWDISAALASQEVMDAFTARLEASRPDWGQAAFRDAAPALVGALARLGPGPELRRIHNVLILVLGTDPDGSAPQWSALADLVEAQLFYGITASEYSANLELLGGQLAALGSSRLVLPALGFVESLCDAPCPASAARVGFLVQVGALLAQLRGNVSHSNLCLFATLATLAGFPVSAPRDEELGTPPESTLAALAGKVVALYSLNTAALARAKSALEVEAPGIVVRCASDERGGGHALRELARTADLFVICTAAATHSATTFIEQERGSRPRRRVHRKGAAALVDEVRRYAHELAA